ncbi:MAG: nucleoside-diphosphate sugar epimerase/dehydratase [Cyanobacteriota bacterium]|nr:nucleoside-diphosphate sugar epimerase/dehydratase [Cyanobacteriota bacterium]
MLIVTDLSLIVVSIWLSFVLRLAALWPLQLQRCLWLVPVTLMVGLVVYLSTGQYQGITRYSGSQSLYLLALRNALVVVLVMAIGLLMGWPNPLPPVRSWLLLWMLITGLTGLMRFVLRDLLLHYTAAGGLSQATVLIYGAGTAGAQLAASLRFAHSHRIAAFLDDDPHLWGRQLNGIPVCSPQALPRLIERHQPSQVLLAIPSLSRQRRRRVVELIQSYGLAVQQVPSVEEITSGRTRVDSVRPVSIEDLLGRDPVPADPRLLGPTIRQQVVLVSGAGGSIGSELCRQILRLGPRRLVMVDSSEPALYAIDQELRLLLQGAGDQLEPVLGSVADEALMDRLMASGINTVIHAAAYKHVPLVESNPMVGLANNVLGTLSIARAAARHGVARFVLISTDKAVRPTNVMGASKRSAELIVQAMASDHPATCFSLVRFGNVLGSSGSVIPLFRRQIDRGGPITLTHPDIIRYFMTIPEAVELVIQASALATGGDLFLLDMGDPVRIQDLASQMVRLSGLSLRTADHPDGDIEIVCTGLRPGEKLYEELLIDSTALPTGHPRIFRARERALPAAQLWSHLDGLSLALRRHDHTHAFAMLNQLVPEWTRDSRHAQPV